ncbi:ribonuclease P protein component 1 [Halobellus limi]|uniref:Ribonuclease P protein component 1 n=1 Tax=Halobellus limi TaxID=699433 RepID=A0A1H5VD64_9EURY|nr:ribonuclease P protein subunit [Halobellus limi]QCC46744.1 ribonuclease P [Halobellus limi]SEF85305.1 ribonuclease P protein subunit POP4 [Halobellus limi]
MALTPETLTRHELNGLRVAVVDAPNPDLVGIEGRVVVETMRTLHVDVSGSDADAVAVESDATATAVGGDADDATETRRARVKQVPKGGTTFEFALPSRDERPGRTDEAADAAKASGTASKLRSETAGGFEAGQSGRRAADAAAASRRNAENCEGVAYVTVDGTRLLSRPALRTEKAGDTLWR